MPVISMFFGILILMYNNGSEHNPPHFHARYGEFEALFALDGTFMKGDMPKRQRKQIEVWADLHADELKANWILAENQAELYKIEPLR